MTPLRYKIYCFIKEYLNLNGYSPTLKEIALGINIKPGSKGLISRYVKSLIEAGWLIMDTRGYRGIQITLPKLQFPVTGKISAGSPIVPVDHSVILDLAEIFWEEGCYALEVTGNSMMGEGILDGDKIICKRQAEASDGTIVVVLIDEQKTTLKRIYHLPNDEVLLEPANPEFQSKIYKKDSVKIQGIFIGLVRVATGKEYKK